MGTDVKEVIDEMKKIIKNGRKIGHGINNPLTSVLGNAELLLEEEMAPSQKEMLNNIRNEGLRIKDLVDQLMDQSQNLQL